MPTSPPPEERRSRIGCRPLRSERPSMSCRSWLHSEAKHHPALRMLSDVAVRHPQTWVRQVQEDVHRLAGAQENGVLPNQVVFSSTVPRQDQETSRAVDVERMVHGMIRALHLVHEPDLDALVELEVPRDLMVYRAGFLIDQLPDHVAEVRLPVDVRHEVLPFEAVPAVAVSVVIIVGSGGGVRRP